MGAYQAREFQIATTTTPRKTVQTTFSTKPSKSIFLKCVCMFLQGFPSKHVNLHICHHKSAPKFQNIIFLRCFQFPFLPKPLKNTAIYTVFFNFSMLANSNIYNHIYKKSFKNIVLYSVFTMFSVKNAVIDTFFGIKSVQNTVFFQCFQCSGIQKPFNISLFTVFFHFCPFFHCRKPTKMTQNSISIPS